MLSRNSSKFEENEIVAEVHPFKAFQREKFNLGNGYSFPLKQRALLSPHEPY